MIGFDSTVNDCYVNQRNICLYWAPLARYLGEVLYKLLSISPLWLAHCFFRPLWSATNYAPLLVILSYQYLLNISLHCFIILCVFGERQAIKQCLMLNADVCNGRHTLNVLPTCVYLASPIETHFSEEFLVLCNEYYYLLGQLHNDVTLKMAVWTHPPTLLGLVRFP